LSSERFKAGVDTNFYGVVNVTRAALPIMRKQKQKRLALPMQTAGEKSACPQISVII
jgi:NADP-dependent 3-hydroxy acid dehydrogenase YdfG